MPESTAEYPSKTSSKEFQGPSLLKAPAKTASELLDDPRNALPSSSDVERGVLSCLLQSADAELLGEAIENLPGVECFHTPAHALIYETVLEMYNASQPIDLISVVQMLQDRKLLDRAGGAAAMSEIFSYSPTAAHFNYYLHILTQKFILRRIIQSCTECITRAYEDQENVDSLLDEVEQRILAIRETRKSKSFANMKDEVHVGDCEYRGDVPQQRPGLRTFDRLCRHRRKDHGHEGR